MALDGKSISLMDYVTLGTSTHRVTWSHVGLGTVLVDHIFNNHKNVIAFQSCMPTLIVFSF